MFKMEILNFHLAVLGLLAGIVGYFVAIERRLSRLEQALKDHKEGKGVRK